MQAHDGRGSLVGEIGTGEAIDSPRVLERTILATVDVPGEF